MDVCITQIHRPDVEAWIRNPANADPFLKAPGFVGRYWDQDYRVEYSSAEGSVSFGLRIRNDAGKLNRIHDWLDQCCGLDAELVPLDVSGDFSLWEKPGYSVTVMRATAADLELCVTRKLEVAR